MNPRVAVLLFVALLVWTVGHLLGEYADANSDKLAKDVCIETLGDTQCMFMSVERCNNYTEEVCTF